MIRRIIAALVMMIFISSQVLGQETDVPAPYRPDEFPKWTLDLRRAEIVTFGSLPISFMLTALVYDVAYLTVDSVNYENNPDLYERASFGSHRTQDDITNLILISGGVSLVIGLTDFIINKVKVSKAEREEQERNEQRNNNSVPSGNGETKN